MEYLQDIIEVNKQALTRTLKQLKFVPLLAIILIVMNLAEYFITSALITSMPSVNFILGFVRYFIRVLFMSAIIGILSDIVLYDKFNINQIFDGYREYFSQVSSTLFVFIILQYLSSMIFSSIQSNVISLVYSLLIYIVMSTVYEEIYIAGQSGLDVFYNTFEFLKDNILQWIIALIVFVFVQFRFDLTVNISIFSLKLFINTLISAILLAFVFIYKGHLFEILNGSSMRKRKFQRKF